MKILENILYTYNKAEGIKQQFIGFEINWCFREEYAKIHKMPVWCSSLSDLAKLVNSLNRNETSQKHWYE